MKRIEFHSHGNIFDLAYYFFFLIKQYNTYWNVKVKIVLKAFSLFAIMMQVL